MQRLQEKVPGVEQDGPEILDFLDFRSFLRARLNHMRSQNTKYSQRWLAKQAGFQSPNLLSMILSGQRSLSKENEKKLCQALKFTPHEQEYFSIIVDLSHAEDAATRQALLDKIKISFQNGLFSSISDEGLEILRDWFIPAIREMLTLKDFQPSTSWMAAALNIEEKEAKAALELLMEKGFVKRTDTSFERSEPSIHNHKRCPPMIIGKYQLQMLEKSFQAAAIPLDKRYFECLTFAIPQRLFPYLVESIKRFCREVDTLVESHEERDEVYQLNLQLFPLTVEGKTKAEEVQ